MGFTGYFGLDKDSIFALGLKTVGSGKAKTAKGIVDYENYELSAEIIDEKQDIAKSCNMCAS